MKTLSFSLLAAALATGLASAETAYTTPVGYNTVNCLQNSDTVCAAPLASSITFVGTTGIPTDNLDGTHSLVLSGNPGLNPAVGFSYYLRFKNGTHSGEIYEITDKTLGATVKVADMDVSLTNVADGALVEIAPFWTLQTLFPDGNSTIIGSASNSAGARKTSILVPTTVAGGSNLAPQSTFFFNTATSDWRSTATGFPNADNFVLWPDSYFFVRHDVTSGPTNYVNTGTVDEQLFTIVLSTSATTDTDNFVAITRPINVRLDALGLGNLSGSVAAFRASTGNTAGTRGDTILVFNNATALRNKAPTSTYFFRNTDNTWRSTATGFPLADATTLNSAEGFIIRKKPTVGGPSYFWVNTKNW